MPTQDEIKEYFECPICNTKSFNPEDIKNHYCGRCHKFIGDEIRNQRMPDGRPLFAWENEIAMLHKDLEVMKKYKELLTLFNFAVHRWQDFTDGSLYIRISINALLAEDFERNPDKYFEIITKE